MKPITMREFAVLCRNDPALNAQTLAIPKTITPEKIFALAERNDYWIVPEQADTDAEQMKPLDEAALESVSGGVGIMTQQEKLDALHTWMYYVMGFGEEKQI